jgi:uncharacterized membrane protein YeaQ/YmgE (transglycosylase-associated protein family)
MENLQPAVWLVTGLIAGWLFGAHMKGRGYGLIGDLVIGVVGVLVAMWTFNAVIPEPQRGEIVAWIVAGVAGALIFIGMARALTRRTQVATEHPAA